MSTPHTIGNFGSAKEFDPHMIGALELGILVSMVLHGVIIASSVSYYRHYVTDVMYVRVVIGILWLLSTTHAGCLLWALYQVTILRLGEPLDFFVIPVTIPLSTAFSSMMQSIVQSVFTYRLYRFSRSLWAALACWALALYEMVGTFIYALSFPYSSVEAQNQHHIKYGGLVFSFLLCAAVLDAAIAITIAVCLHNGQAAAMGATKRAVDRLETWTLRTGMVTSFIALAIAVNFGLDRQNNIWLALYFVLTNLYPLTLMTLFNGRRELILPDHEPSSERGFSLNHLRATTEGHTTSIGEITGARPNFINTRGGLGVGLGGGGGGGIWSEGSIGLNTMLQNHPVAAANNKIGRTGIEFADRQQETTPVAVVVSLDVVSDAHNSDERDERDVVEMDREYGVGDGAMSFRR
ncbi:hypothetical protein AX16_002559 [Volvariella volvacea WC 439]|nr:hypothetical protein AX16_002559 [Volvariella volvacea WC 439]